MTGRALDSAIAGVVRSGNCSGCGLCALLDDGIQLQRDDAGFNRPVRVAASGIDQRNAASRFRRACPGVRVAAQRPEGSVRHPTMGPVVGSWAAWATDAEIRRVGSSGGVLTALTAWLTETGEASRVIGARSDPVRPSTTVSVTIMSRDEAIAAAGSRYGPASNAAVPEVLSPGAAVVGKPCEVSALRALTPLADPPLLMSFYCAGTPSQLATDSLIEKLGIPAGAELTEMWYRGRGWPGEFTAVAAGGSRVSTTYDESWGDHLGPAVQWRCKICPDGVGESADITAADFWTADENGYPDFTEGDGVSALIARTARGADVVRRAFKAGVLDGYPMDVADLAAVQPLQVRRRRSLAGRLAGAVAGGARVPWFAGFGLVGFAVTNLREAIRTARGTYGRVRATTTRSARSTR